MHFKNILIFLSSLFVFIFSVTASWYEGAQVLDMPLEWKHSAIFSNWVNGEVAGAEEILVVDYFVYAMKFAPTFPLLMFLSGVILAFQVFFLACNGQSKWITPFFGVMATGSFLAVAMLSGSPTIGLKLFAAFFATLGIGSIGYIFFFRYQQKSSDEKLLMML